MAVLLVGIGIVIFAVYTVTPGIAWGPGWGRYVLMVIKGGIPLVAFFSGVLILLIGIADVKERIETRRERRQYKIEPDSHENTDENTDETEE